MVRFAPEDTVRFRRRSKKDQKLILAVAVASAIVALSGCSSNNIRVADLGSLLAETEQENLTLRISVPSLKGVETSPASAGVAEGWF